MSQPPRSHRTLAALFAERAQALADKHFVYSFGPDEGGAVTFGEIERRALCIAAAIRAANQPGVDQAPRAALLLPNGPLFVAAFFGALLAGCAVVPIDPRLRSREIRLHLERSGARALLTAFSTLTPDLDVPDHCLALDAERLAAEPPPAQIDAISPARAAEPSDAAVILGTSGSTSAPKAVVLSHRSLLSNALAFSERYRFTEHDVLATVLSLSHSFGITACLLAALVTGARVALVDEPLPARVASLCARRGATVFLAAASFYQYLVRSEATSEADFPRVRHFIAGACSLPVEMAQRFQRKFNRPILQTYGLTEASPVVTANPPEQNRLGTVGTALPGAELRLIDERGDEIPRAEGSTGELCVRGEFIMKGYDKNPEATARCLDAAGWLRTGDLARIDDAGYVTLLGRSKDLIVRGGEKIYPEEIEETLHRHAGVAEAAVVGAPDPVFEEIPVAFVVPAREGLDVAELRAHCRDQLAPYKIPRRFELVAELPRNPNGKILKRALRDALASERAEPPGGADTNQNTQIPSGGSRGADDR